MRRIFTTQDATGHGLTFETLRWGERAGRWRRVQRGVYGDGPDAPTELDRQRAKALLSGGVARGCLAGVLHGLDSVWLDRRPLRRADVPDDRIVLIEGIRCADG